MLSKYLLSAYYVQSILQTWEINYEHNRQKSLPFWNFQWEVLLLVLGS